jgi:ribose transport system permease protein
MSVAISPPAHHHDCPARNPQTTNSPVTQWATTLADDATPTAALLDRLRTTGGNCRSKETTCWTNTTSQTCRVTVRQATQRSIPGTLLGCLIIGVLNNGLALLDVSPFWQQVVKGTVIILAVALDRWGVGEERLS